MRMLILLVTAATISVTCTAAQRPAPAPPADSPNDGRTTLEAASGEAIAHVYAAQQHWRYVLDALGERDLALALTYADRACDETRLAGQALAVEPSIAVPMGKAANACYELIAAVKLGQTGRIEAAAERYDGYIRQAAAALQKLQR